MTQQGYESLVRRLESFAKRSPKAYRRNVALLAALGYGYIGLMLVVLVGLVLLLIVGGGLLLMSAHGASAVYAVKLGVPLGIGLASLIGVIARSFSVHLTPPEGFLLRREDVPSLFGPLDELCAKLSAPRFDEVFLDADFNAGVLQLPRFGLFGGHKNFLILGLPLMLALSPEQFRAVLAHEVGHLSRSHSRFAGWIYRLRQTWFQLLRNLIAEEHGGIDVFLPFFNWYAPYFFAYSFVLARSNEYVADACAAQVSGAQTAAEALIATQIAGRYFSEEFWPRQFDKAREQPAPPDRPCLAFAESLKTDLKPHEATGWYQDSLDEKTGVEDTHPTLSERLAALGFRGTAGGALDLPKPPLPLPAQPVQTAASIFLGPAFSRYSASLDAQWKTEMGPQWREAHTQAEQARRKLDVLDSMAQTETLSKTEAWEQAMLTAQVWGGQYAVPLLREVVAAQPDHARAHFALGRVLLEQNDAAGVDILRRAIRMEPTVAAAGNAEISRFYRRNGRPTEAAKSRQQAQQGHIAADVARSERTSLRLSDTFLPHGLSPEMTHRLRAQLSIFEQIGAVYFVRKQVRFHPETPLYVLGIVPAPKSITDGEDPQAFGRRIFSKLTLPGQTIPIVLVGDAARFLGPISNPPGAKII